MRKLITLSCVLLLTLSATIQNNFPDLSRKEDLIKMGIGKIIEKDNSIIKKITLAEIKDYWIIYLKDESLHDKAMESIKRIEFPESKWGRLKVEFPNNKPEVSFLTYN